MKNELTWCSTEDCKTISDMICGELQQYNIKCEWSEDDGNIYIELPGMWQKNILYYFLWVDSEFFMLHDKVKSINLSSTYEHNICEYTYDQILALIILRLELLQMNLSMLCEQEMINKIVDIKPLEELLKDIKRNNI